MKTPIAKIPYHTLRDSRLARLAITKQASGRRFAIYDLILTNFISIIYFFIALSIIY
jgi:hypothetical protein